MSDHLCTTLLHESEICAIEEVRCRPVTSSLGGEERAGQPGFAFVRRGVFRRHTPGRRLFAGPNDVVFFDPEVPYRVSHPIRGGDDCLWFSYHPTVLAEGLRDGPMPLVPRTVLALHALRRELASPGRNRLRVDEAAMAALRMVLAETVRQNRGEIRRRATTAEAHRALVERTRGLLAANPAARWSLGSLARSVASSPFHLARVFRNETGIPIHRHLTLLRLSRALEALAEEPADLTDLALELGFSSHAHFTAVFSATFGLSPSVFRRAGAASGLRKLRKNLKA